MKRLSFILVFIIFSLISCVPVNGLWGGQGEESMLYTQDPAPPGSEPASGSHPASNTTALADHQLLLWVSSAVPPALLNGTTSWQCARTDDAYSADLVLDVQTETTSDASPSSTWVYTLVAPFPTVADGVTADELRRAWVGEPAGPFGALPLWMDGTTLAAMTSVLGEPATGSVVVVDTGDLLEDAWTGRPSWGIVPFEELDPRWKVLAIDGQSPIHRDFQQESYLLKVVFSLQSPTADATAFRLPASNRDPSRMTVLVMTGVTALVRATAHAMELNGILFPARDIRDWLVDADLTHISNEIPFAEDCPYPDPSFGMRPFCSDPRYIGLMEDIGTDIVELTGNHFQDWGSAATLMTIDMYDQRGWLHYGGGSDLEQARQAVVVESNGNRLAFIGCNTVGPDYAWATETQPGAASCDFPWMQAEVSRLKQEGYLPIVTFQHNEYYTLTLHVEQQVHFRSMIDAGAVIVSGSQSHTPQGVEFFSTGFIHYGLGNLFFDQMDDLNTRQEFIDRHVFYNGRHISTELLTAMLEDYARPRPMTAEERQVLLSEAFAAGTWTTWP